MVSITTEELFEEHSSDKRCREVMEGIKQEIRGAFAYNDEGLIVQKVEKEAHIVIPKVRRHQVLDMAHYLATSGHPGGRRTHTLLRSNFNLSGLALDYYKTLKQGPSCTKNRTLEAWEEITSLPSPWSTLFRGYRNPGSFS